jgi:hypothetical protein
LINSDENRKASFVRHFRSNIFTSILCGFFSLKSNKKKLANFDAHVEKNGKCFDHFLEVASKNENRLLQTRHFVTIPGLALTSS